MKISTFASITILGSTMAGSLMLSPVRPQPARSAPVAQTLPSTGTQVAISRIKHGIELEAPLTPTEIYGQYVPPPDPPAPVVVVAAAAAPRAWAPTPGYVTIPVPVYRQTRNLNCETAAMQMGLAYYGHYYSQDSLFAYENADLRRAQWINGTLHWGDPYTNFVGDVNGSESALTGYGVYYPVILAIARSHGVPNAYGGEGFSPATVYAELAAGHPVQIWIEARWSRPAVRTWTAWDGRSIRYSLAEHSVILTGVSPTMVRVNDDQFGSQYWVSKWTFETSWRDFNNMAVIYR
ncbi:MAG TPA: C39 family peptidase [Candidatus Dormibacteraeota bacterium]|nr:C39 family peptidase [Candidatus Dormibacteraeota bacterium]